MNILSTISPAPWRSALLASLTLLSLPLSSQARDWGHQAPPDRAREFYLTQPRSGFTMTMGNGWRGRGYYYGPPNTVYFYERPGVVYYERRDQVPSSYYGSERGSERGSSDSAVQRALARRGYYRGPIDGDIGPGSRRAIARYQEDHGLRPTGAINSYLLRSLGL